MKKKLKFILIVMLILPISVKANIYCNDNTVSDSCTYCHQGCCSHHGGCTEGYVPPTTTRRVKTTTKPRTTTTRQTTRPTTTTRLTTTTTSTSTTTTTELTTVPEVIEEPTTEVQETTTTQVIEDTNSTYEETSTSDTIVGAIGTGVIGYGIYALVRKVKDKKE